ncbi:hypothetical protein HDU67_007379 [Dinochytrium kinnereticum]|nr:hypothetical protein HDU67_007379 [Dinochytrium kinnereticum]
MGDEDDEFVDAQATSSETTPSQIQRTFSVTAATLSRPDNGGKRRPSPDSLDWLGKNPEAANSLQRSSPLPNVIASALKPSLTTFDPSVATAETTLAKAGRLFVNLFLTPFVQGMFYGLGEGAARIVLFRVWGIQALGPVQRTVKDVPTRNTVTLQGSSDPFGPWTDSAVRGECIEEEEKTSFKSMRQAGVLTLA